MNCCICGRVISNKNNSHNPYPVRPTSNDINDVNGRCCSKCNDRYVITCRSFLEKVSEADLSKEIEKLQHCSAAELDKLFKDNNIVPNDETMFETVRSELKKALDKKVGEYLLPNFPSAILLQPGEASKEIRSISKYYAEYLNGQKSTDETWNSFINDNQILVKMLSDDGHLIFAMSDEIKANKELALIAIKSDQGIYKFIAPELQLDVDVAIATLKAETIINPVIEFDYPNEICDNPKFLEVYEKLKAEHKLFGHK